MLSTPVKATEDPLPGPFAASPTLSQAAALPLVHNVVIVAISTIGSHK